jgi:hypothetical protein
MPGMVLSISMAARKGSTLRVDLLVDAGDGRIEGVDLVQMQLEQEAVMLGHPAAQRAASSSSAEAWMRRWASAARAWGMVWPAIKASMMRRPLRPRMSVTTESSLMLASSSVFWMRWMWLAAFAHHLLAGAQQVAHLLGRFVGHEAGPDQPMRHQIGQPCGVVDVGLAARHVLDVGRVGQDQLELAVGQNVPDRLPVNACRLHGDVRRAFADSHSDKAISSWVVVLKVLTTVVTLLSAMWRTQATTESLCTSRPAQCACKTSIALLCAAGVEPLSKEI